MKSLAELSQNKQSLAKELSRKDSIRRACVTEFTQRLNEERRRENAEKVERYMWANHVSRTEALRALKAEKDKSKKIWPLYTERAIHFKTVHLDSADLRDFLDRCNTAEKDGRSFGKVFNGLLKIK